VEHVNWIPHSEIPHMGLDPEPKLTDPTKTLSFGVDYVANAGLYRRWGSKESNKASLDWKSNFRPVVMLLMSEYDIVL
jgi:hypothetical protein